MAKALVLFSGGMDSTYCLYDAINWYGKDEVATLTFDYGQSHDREIASAEAITQFAGVKQQFTMKISGLLHSTSSLTDKAVKLPEYKSYEEAVKALKGKVEPAQIPMRNTIFAALAVNMAVSLGCELLYLGICQEDAATMPDCSRYWFTSLAKNVIESGISSLHLRAPLLYKAKSEAIKDGIKRYPGYYTALAQSHTSYSNDWPPIVMDHAGLCRSHAFEEACIPDPMILVAVWRGLMDFPSTANYDSVRDLRQPRIEEVEHVPNLPLDLIYHIEETLRKAL